MTPSTTQLLSSREWRGTGDCHVLIIVYILRQKDMTRLRSKWITYERCCSLRVRRLFPTCEQMIIAVLQVEPTLLPYLKHRIARDPYSQPVTTPIGMEMQEK